MKMQEHNNYMENAEIEEESRSLWSKKQRKVRRKTKNLTKSNMNQQDSWWRTI